MQNLFNLVILFMLAAAWARNIQIYNGAERKPVKVNKGTLIFGAPS